MRVAIAGVRGTKQSTFICDVRLCLQSRPYLHLVPSGHTVSGALRASGLSESVKVYPSGHPPSDALRASGLSESVKVYPSGHPPSDALRASEPSGFVKV